ncbi:MAG TPA: hypothetical protein VMI75_10495 [Polyangiaceae bacterium]|nr:hypothetical protein [Polyangiaceae bacterium]
MSRTVCTIALALALALAPAAARPARAQSAPPPAAAPAHAARDTTRFLPDWIRPWLEIGGGWMSGPARVKSHYESGQEFGAGLEGRFGNRWALRLGMAYQILQANHDDSLIVVTAETSTGQAVLDTAGYSYQNAAWIGTLALEPGVRVIGDFWLTGGLGVGYMRSGFDGSDIDYGAINLPKLPGALTSGWGWAWTASTRWDFQPAPEAPLSLELRTSTLARNGDNVQTWVFKVMYRVPNLPHDNRRRGRRGDDDR